MPEIQFFDKWTCFILIGLCVLCAEGKLLQHQHYHSKPTVHGNVITFNDGEYQPAVGEILAKDSILYSQKPESRLLRRQLWPIMQETMDTLVDSVAVGANLFNNILASNSNPIATKIRNIKSAYISSGTTSARSHKKLTKGTNSKKLKIKYTPAPPVRTRTVSGDYVHTYDDGAYTVPSYVIKSASKNPYAQMGLKDYKHFEETVLRELEEKEEKKFEATMSTLYKNKPNNIEEELVQGIPYGGWRPVQANIHAESDNSLVVSKAKHVGKLHTSIANFNDVKPIHEEVNESQIIPQVHHQIIFEQSATNNNDRRRQPRLRSNRSSTTTTMSPRPFTRKPTSEEPNYPGKFLSKKNSKADAREVSTEIDYMKKLSLNREHAHGFTTTSPNRPPIDGSNRQSAFITPLAEEIKDDDRKQRQLNRQKIKISSDGKTGEQSAIGNRGSIKFSDSL